MTRFHWTCAYLNRSWFKVIDNSHGAFEIVLRHGVSDYEREIANYDDDYWQKQVVAGVGKICRDPQSFRPLPKDIVESFNEWRLAKYYEAQRSILSQPNRYDLHSVQEYEAALGEPPKPVSAVHYDTEARALVPTHN